MKKLLILTLSIVFLSACGQKLNEVSDTVNGQIEAGKASINNVVDEAKELKQDIDNAKEAIKEIVE